MGREWLSALYLVWNVSFVLLNTDMTCVQYVRMIHMLIAILGSQTIKEALHWMIALYHTIQYAGLLMRNIDVITPSWNSASESLAGWLRNCYWILPKDLISCLQHILHLPYEQQVLTKVCTHKTTCYQSHMRPSCTVNSNTGDIVTTTWVDSTYTR